MEVLLKMCTYYRPQFVPYYILWVHIFQYGTRFRAMIMPESTDS